MDDNTCAVLCVASVCGLLAVACWASGSAAPVLVPLGIVCFILLLMMV